MFWKETYFCPGHILEPREYGIMFLSNSLTSSSLTSQGTKSLGIRKDFRIVVVYVRGRGDYCLERRNQSVGEGLEAGFQLVGGHLHQVLYAVHRTQHL